MPKRSASPTGRQAIVRNGLRPEEFEPVAAAADARDFVFVGTLRDLKGPDVFIEALARLHDDGGPMPTAAIVGAGEDKPRYAALVRDRGLSGSVIFLPPMPARQAFALGRVMVVPSRAELMPYIVLEAIAAGLPLVATKVGGIPEIMGEDSRISSRRATLHGLPPPCGSAGTTCQRRETRRGPPRPHPADFFSRRDGINHQFRV